VQNPYEFGFQSVKMMAALARGDKKVIPADGMFPIDFRIITKDGKQEYPETVHGQKKSIAVKEFRDQLNELLGKKMRIGASGGRKPPDFVIFSAALG